MSTHQPAIMSASLGRAWLHDMDDKLQQASEAGFKGVEIFYEDLEYLARTIAGVSDHSQQPRPEDLLSAADHVYQVCQACNLEIIGLQPFLFCEGLKDRGQYAVMIEKMKLWLQIVARLHTDTIQIPANFLLADQLVSDPDIIASDLRQFADMAASATPTPVRFAYENLCWSTHVDTWEKLWDVVEKVDRPNFGVCLDTFNIAGRAWADPTTPTGKAPNANAHLAASLQEMVKRVDVRKVFYIQVVDAERMIRPLVEGHPFYVEGQPARMSWSRNARTFMYETDRGAYLPAEDVTKAIIEGLGYRGYVSMELFSRTMSEAGCQVPREHARRGMKAWERLCDRMQVW